MVNIAEGLRILNSKNVAGMVREDPLTDAELLHRSNVVGAELLCA